MSLASAKRLKEVRICFAWRSIGQSFFDNAKRLVIA
jgi:hypothetical protein